MRMRLFLLVAALFLVGCAKVKGIGDILDWIRTEQGGPSTPSPASPGPSPIVEPSTAPTPNPPASPETSPSPNPVPTGPPPASPAPCETPKPLCVKKDGTPAGRCVSCAQWTAEQLAAGELTREGDLLVQTGTRGKEYLDPRTCHYVYGPGDTRTRNKRPINDGDVCEPGCSKTPPSPCAPPPAPQASPLPGASPNPQATPATCPPLMRVGGGLFNCQRNGIPKSCDGPLDEGDKVTLDSTHHFGRRTASACDEPWDKPCGGRMCDDTNGGTKFIVERGEACRQTGTHQLTCGPLVRGPYRIRLCPNDDYRDQLGQKVDTSQAECTVVEFDVR